ncbi:arginine repressor C-terminal-like domain-containing protein, partial [Tanacetum coccineum]
LLGNVSLLQGDPLSPFLFLIVAEALQVLTLKACNKCVYKGLSLAEDGANVSLLQYADDALFFGEWSYSNANTLVRILKCFQDVSGLKVNLSKSRLFGVGVPLNEVASVAEAINCTHDKLPFIYLGLSVGRNMRIDSPSVFQGTTSKAVVQPDLTTCLKDHGKVEWF